MTQAKKKTSARVAKIAGRLLERAKAIKKLEGYHIVIDVKEAITLAASVLSQVESQPTKKKAKARAK